MFKKIELNRLITLIALAVAGSVIFELPYMKYLYYDGMIEAFNITNEQSGMLLSVYAIGCMIGYIPGGFLADRLSPKKLLVWSLFATSVLGFLLAFNMNYSFALVIWFLFAVSTSFVFWTAINKAVRIVGGSDDQGSAYGWYYALKNLVALACGFIFFYAYSSHQGNAHDQMFWLIISMSLSVLVSAILVFFIYKEDETFAVSNYEDKFKIKDLPHVLKNPYVWLASLIMFLIYALQSCSYYFTPYFTAHFGFEPTESAFMGIFRSYFLFFLAPIGGFLADKIFKSTLKLFGYGFVILAVSYTCVLLIPSEASSANMAIALSFLSAAVSIILYGIMWSILAEMKIPTVYAATAIGITSLITYTPDLFMHTIFGNWLDTYGEGQGYFLIFLTLALFSVIGAVLSFFFAKKIKNKKDGECVESGEVA